MSGYRSYTSRLAKYDPHSGFARTSLLEGSAVQPCIGVYSMKIVQASVKYLKDFSIPETAILCSSIYNSYEIDETGTSVTRFMPLNIVKLEGQKNSDDSFCLTSVPELNFADKIEVSFWLQDYSRAKLENVELNVLFFMKRAN